MDVGALKIFAYQDLYFKGTLNDMLKYYYILQTGQAVVVPSLPALVVETGGSL